MRACERHKHNSRYEALTHLINNLLQNNYVHGNEEREGVEHPSMFISHNRIHLIVWSLCFSLPVIPACQLTMDFSPQNTKCEKNVNEIDKML